MKKITLLLLFAIMLFSIHRTNAQYCVPSGSAGNGAFIGEVCFPITSNPFNNCNQTNSGGNYGDYTGLGSRATYSPTPTAPNTNQVLVRVDRSNAGDYVFAGYIDFNQDEDFDDAGEQVFSGSGNIPFPSGGGASHNQTVTVPASASNGATRLRLIAKEGTTPVSGPCETGFNGEAEDYIITITGGGVACPTISFTETHTNEGCPGANDGSISITSSSGGISPYTYSINGGGTYQSTATFSGLAPNTYQVRVKDANDCESANQAVIIATGVDTTPPVISCQGNITQDNDPGVCGAVVTFIAPVGTDNCSGATTVQTAGFASGATFPVGITTNTFEVTDAAGNTASCSFDVTVNDTEDPIITCPGNIIQDNDPGTCGAVVTFTDPTVTDNCSNLGDIVTFSYTGSPQTFTVPAGVTSLSIEAWGAAGQDFTVEQYTPTTGGLGGYASGELTVTPGDVITIYVGGAGADNMPGYNGGALGGYGNPSDGLAGRAGSGGGASDIRTGAATITDRVLVAGGGGGGGRDYVNGTCQPCGMGGNGGAGGALIGIDGEDPTDPIYGSYLNPGASGKGGSQTNGGAGGDGPQGPNGMPGTLGVGGIGIDGNYSIASGGGGGGYYGGGSGAGADSGSGAGGAGGAGGSSYIGGVNNGTTMPGIRSGAGEVIITIASTLTIAQTAGLPSGSTFPIGLTTNTYVATDAAGNTSTCSFDVIVNDTEAPAITCPGNITQDNDPGVCGAVITYTTPIGTDNCAGSTTAQTTGLPSGSEFPVGTTTNTFVVTDASGNTASCSFDITINDTEAPVANCAAPFTIQLDAAGMASIAASDIDNGSTDNCSIASTSIDVTDFDCSNVGPNTVTLTVTDVNGNSSTCTTIVTVEDNVAPVANCAAPFTIQLDANGMASITVADIENGSTDACGIASTTIDITDFDCSNVGPNTVTLTVTDVNGNVSTCTTIVTVEDSIAPIIACPADIDANTEMGSCFAVVSYAMPIALDNCGIDNIVQTAGLPSGSQFPVGVNTIEFTATDVNGNSSSCSFTITVTDNEVPVAVCQNITIELDEFGNASITASDVDGGSTDQCGVASTTIDIDTFDCSNVGDNNVVLTVTDVNGNVSTCTAIVTVEDVTVPVVACQNIVVELDPITGTFTIAGTDIDNGSSDACGIASYELDIDTFDCSNIGDNDVILTVTDVNGNTATCNAVVTVEDNTAPVLVCQDFTLELGPDGTAILSPSDVVASNDDACGIFTTAVDITHFSCDDIGTPVTVQVFSQDNNGNLATCTSIVTVVDNLAPVVICPADQTVDPGAGNIFYIVPDYFATGEATAVDNCTDPVTILTQDPAPGAAIPDGIYTVTLTAEDQYGNIGSCDFQLTVESILGVGNNSQSLGSIAMYPNPAKGIVTIGNPQTLELERADIYDLMGRLVQSFSLKGMATTKTLNVDNLAAATYVVIIKGKEGQIAKRLIKE